MLYFPRVFIPNTLCNGQTAVVTALNSPKGVSVSHPLRKPEIGASTPTRHAREASPARTRSSGFDHPDYLPENHRKIIPVSATRLEIIPYRVSDLRRRDRERVAEAKDHKIREAVCAAESPPAQMRHKRRGKGRRRHQCD